MMREVGVHDNHKIPSTELQAVDIGGPIKADGDNDDVRKSEYTYPSPSLPALGFNAYKENSVGGMRGKHW